MSDGHDAGDTPVARPLAPRPRLLAFLLITFFIWIAALVILNLRT